MQTKEERKAYLREYQKLNRDKLREKQHKAYLKRKEEMKKYSGKPNTGLLRSMKHSKESRIQCMSMKRIERRERTQRLIAKELSS